MNENRDDKFQEEYDVDVMADDTEDIDLFEEDDDIGDLSDFEGEEEQSKSKFLFEKNKNAIKAITKYEKNNDESFFSQIKLIDNKFVAKKGFSNYPFKKEFYVVNLAMLETKYSDGETVNKESLMQKGLLRKGSLYVKVLGTGDITKKLTGDVDRISASAKKKISKKFKYYNLSLYTYSLASYIEIMLSGNLAEKNILSIKEEIEKL